VIIPVGGVSPAPVPPPTGGVPPPGGFWRPCSEVARSITSVTIVPIEFVNTSSQPRRLYWIDFAGTPQNYGVLSPGQSGFINSWVTHSWVIADLANNCLETFVVSGAERRVEIR
jgi:VHL beta domain